MKYIADTPEAYIAQLPADRKAAFSRLWRTIRDSLPAGFGQGMQYGMAGIFVPFEIYPQGYHVNPKEPLPFLGLAAQKGYIALYHMGLYMFPEVLDWFQQEYPGHTASRPDMGKSCIRFRDPDRIPYDLIAGLCQKITPAEYIARYEQSLRVR